MTQRLDETNEVRETRSAALTQEELAARGLPPYCFIKHPHENTVVKLTRGVMGFTPTLTPLAALDALNASLGITPQQLRAMTNGSMFGFHVPGAFLGA